VREVVIEGGEAVLLTSPLHIGQLITVKRKIIDIVLALFFSMM
jgi:hypothetical protein